MSHMSKGSGASFESPLHSLPLYPSHQLCEMGELTQTGMWGCPSPTQSPTRSCIGRTRVSGPPGKDAVGAGVSRASTSSNCVLTKVSDSTCDF